MKIGVDFKYKKIENFLSKEEIDLCREYLKIKHRTNVSSFDHAQSDNLDSKFYADPLTESILINKKSLVEKESGLKLYPTYSFSRIYSMFGDLKKHIDRPSCEVSVTVCVDSVGESWPIYMDNTSIILNPGDAALYLGCEVEHWRDELKGDYQSQFFLHYVNQEGKNKKYKWDTRFFIGGPEHTRRGI
tara:strand:- start:54 stop:617 length:564 start_codon:yes stop_codon:yes gene_type:complete